MYKPIGKFFMLIMATLPSTLILSGELCSFDSDRTGLFEWDMFEMAAPIQSPAKCKVRSDHKTKRMDSGLKFLTRYAQEGDEFLDSIVTCFFT